MFRISKLADYAVVVLADMARTGDALLSAALIAGQTNISEPTAAKVLKMLLRAGLVVSVRGAAGGYRLAHRAHEISVVTIIEAIEGPIALTACVDGLEPDCALGACCAVRGRWDSVNQALRSALEGVMLTDMMRPNTRKTIKVEEKGAAYGGH